jgi:hypothetical protein
VLLLRGGGGGGDLVEVRFGRLLLSSLLSGLESEIGVSRWLLDHCVENVAHALEDSESLPYLKRGISKIIIAKDCCPRWMQCPALFFVKS